MQTKLIFITALFFNAAIVAGQQNVGIGTGNPNASAQLDITATNRGLLIPRMNAAAIAAISNPARGLMVLDTAINRLMFNTGTAAAPNWQSIAFNSGWGVTGNAGTNDAVNFIGTTDNTALRFRVNNVNAGQIDPVRINTFLGVEAGNTNQTGVRNIGIGFYSLQNNGTGQKNTAIGAQSLRSSFSGSDNTAVGYDAMFSNDGGSINTAFGENALRTNNSGNENVAVGGGALYFNEFGNNNTAVGTDAGRNTLGNGNVFIGYNAGYQETGSDRLYIQNSYGNASAALIYGEFDNQLLQINGRLKINVVEKAVGLDLGAAAIKVSGTNPAVFTITATAAAIDLVIPNTSMANSNTDILIVTHRLAVTKLNTSPGVYWNGTNWVIFLENYANHIVGEKYNVMVIKQ